MIFLEESSEKNHATKEELNMSKVMVIGAGTMGSGIAQVFATHGWDVV